MDTVAETLIALIRGFGFPYLIAVACLSIVLGFVWMIFVRPARKGRIIVTTLFIALAFAPSLFGFDLGAITLPAIIIMILGSSRSVALQAYSMLSIICTWGVVLGIVFMSRRHHPAEAGNRQLSRANNKTSPD